jgi:hypothetical protein
MLTIWHKAIAVSQIVGGGFGLIIIIISIMRPESLAFPPGFYYYSPIIFAIALFAGILFWKRSIAGYRLTLATQTIQLIQISTGLFTYKVTLGLQLALVFGSSWFRLSPGFNISSWVGESTLGLPDFIAINAFSFIALIYLLKTRRKIFPSEVLNNNPSTRGESDTTNNSDC